MRENCLTEKVSIAFLYENQHRAGQADEPDLYMWNIYRAYIGLGG